LAIRRLRGVQRREVPSGFVPAGLSSPLIRSKAMRAGDARSLAQCAANALFSPARPLHEHIAQSPRPIKAEARRGAVALPDVELRSLRVPAIGVIPVQARRENYKTTLNRTSSSFSSAAIHNSRHGRISGGVPFRVLSNELQRRLAS
jgi:hypothetical protein